MGDGSEGGQGREQEGGAGRRIVSFLFGDATRIAITAAVIAVVGIVVTIVIAVVDDDGPRTVPGSSGAVADPKNLVEEIAARDFWAGQVGTFEAANDGDMDGYPVDLEFGYDVTPTSVDDLVTDAASEDNSNRATLLVGRVDSSLAFDYEFPERGGLYDLATETRLVGRNGDNDVYVATAVGTFRRGEVLIVFGELAAYGPSRSPENKRMQTAYFVSDTNVDATSVPTSLFTDIGSDAVRDLAQEAARYRLP